MFLILNPKTDPIWNRFVARKHYSKNDVVLISRLLSSKMHSHFGEIEIHAVYDKGPVLVRTGDTPPWSLGL